MVVVDDGDTCPPADPKRLRDQLGVVNVEDGGPVQQGAGQQPPRAIHDTQQAPGRTDEDERERQIDELVAEYVEVLNAGIPLRTEEILKAHRELGREIVSRLDAFVDVGSTWTENDQLRLFEKNENGKTVTRDLLIGTGYGFRFYFIFLWRLDIAWSYDLEGFSRPKYYVSLGLDF